MKLKSLLWLLLCSTTFAHAKTLSVDDILYMERMADGRYQVVCNDDREEIVTIEQIQANQVCLPPPSNILGVERRADGRFNVYCADRTQLVVTAEELRSGLVCKDNAPVPKPVMGGHYKQVDGECEFSVDAYAPDDETPGAWTVYAENTNRNFCDLYLQFQCLRGETFCRGIDNDETKRGLLIASKTSFALTDENGGNAMWLTLIEDDEQAPPSRPDPAP